jgi:DNA polymerase-3 subunit delta'
MFLPLTDIEDEQERLTKAYQSNKLSHAYLFEGDDGQTMQQVAT